MKMEKFSLDYNKTYNFTCPEHKAVIEVVDTYRLEDDQDEYSTGDKIESPWGSNQVLEAYQTEEGVDVCLKELVVNPSQMLSLQRHRGRAEKWEVRSGTLTVILDGVRHDIETGKYIDIPQGAVHCMINVADSPVTVIETQTGVNREKDNIRLVDFSRRPTYPLTTENEVKSAQLYCQIMKDIQGK